METKKHGGPRPGSGRPKGSKNKRTAEVEETLREMECNPIEGMVIIANRAMDEGDLPLAGQMYKELAQYIAPKKKAVEVSGPDNGPIQGRWEVEFVNATPKG